MHSPVGRNPEQYGITLVDSPVGAAHGRDLFAKNDIAFIDPTGVDHDALGLGLNKALYNYMHGLALDEDVRSWFGGGVPRTRVPKAFIRRALVSSRA